MTIQNIETIREQLTAAFRDAQGDVQTRTFFANGYGVSVVRFFGSYGYHQGLFELAVLKGDPQQHDLCHDTHITGDVLGWLTPEEVVALTEKVSKL